MSLTIAIRVDASPQMGSGHLMRCLTLADALAARGAHVTFLTRPSAGPLLDLVRANGHGVVVLEDGVRPTPPAAGKNGGSDPMNPTYEAKGSDPQDLTPDTDGTTYAHWLPVTIARDAEQTLGQTHGSDPWDWLIVDHYALDARWERALRPHAKRLMVIDDLADRPHDCDLLLDQNLVAEFETRYDGRVPETCTKLLGPTYALLRPQFAAARKALGQRGGLVRRILVFFGGSDMSNETGKALDAIALLDRTDFEIPPLEVDVVVGAACPHAAETKARVAAMPAARFHQQTPDMAALMAEADLAIGAGGSATWERCCLGLPAIVITVAENQVPTAVELGWRTAILHLGNSAQVQAGDIAAALRTLDRATMTVAAMSARASELCDGRGVGRVLAAMEVGPVKTRVVLRRADAGDNARLLAWRNDPSARGQSLTKHEISQAEHDAWFVQMMTDHNQITLIGEVEAEPIGVVRYVCTGAVARVSITVAPAAQGRGRGEAMLRAGQRWLCEYQPGITTIEAEILPANAASRRSFVSAGFREEKLCYKLDLKA